MAEFHEQIAFFDWIKIMRLNDQRYCLVVGFPFEGQMKVQFRVKQAKMGRPTGFPDIGILYPVKPYPGMFIEMKSKSGIYRKSQKTWKEALQKAGYPVRLCRSSDEAIEIAKSYFNGTLEPENKRSENE